MIVLKLLQYKIQEYNRIVGSVYENRILNLYKEMTLEIIIGTFCLYYYIDKEGIRG